MVEDFPSQGRGVSVNSQYKNQNSIQKSKHTRDAVEKP
jgi:hypothetical protein